MDWQGLYADRMALIGDRSIIELLKLAERPDVISFAGGLPDPSSFPLKAIKEVTDWVLDNEGRAALQYGPTAGYTALREWIADRMAHVDQVSLTADHILISTGGLEAMDLIARTFINPGDTVIVEAPTYLAALHVFRSYQAEIVDVPMDDQGMQVDILEDRLKDLQRRGIRPKLLYTVPTFQNPSGVTLSAERRHRLVEIADRYGVPIFEDPAYSELRFEGDPPPSLISLNPDGVLFASTFSKTFGPGVRLGWIAAPPAVHAQLCQAKQGSDQCSSTLAQRIIYEYGRRGLLEPHIAASINLYRAKRNKTLETISDLFPSGTSWTHPEGGFYLWVTLPEGVDTTSMLSWAIEHEKVAYVAGSPFYAHGQGKNQFRICYSFPDITQIEEGVHRLARVVTHHIERRHQSSHREVG
jgi:2-aminoadipate transaminase